MQRNKIYKTKRWYEIRKKVLKLDHYECQRCKGEYPYDVQPSDKRITPATLVHHYFIAEEYPQYKYDIYVKKDGKTVRNLYSLCNDCHEFIHRRTHRNHFEAKEPSFINEERFD